MLTLIYPFRNRDLKRIENSLNSLKNQKNQNFEVIFVDYGSSLNLSKKVRELVGNYTFVKYLYSYTEGRPWSRSKALNIGIKNSQTDFVVTVDVDMIFDSRFTEKLKDVSNKKLITFFKVGYLPKGDNSISNLKPESYSNQRAKGICVYPLKELNAVGAFDEFYHCWGGEDEDLVYRLKSKGLNYHFYEKEVLVFHQYHKIYKNYNDFILTEELKISLIRHINNLRLKFNAENGIILANKNLSWGKIIEKEVFEKLLLSTNKVEISSYKPEVDFFINERIKLLDSGVHVFKFNNSKVPKRKITIKYILYRIYKFKLVEKPLRELYYYTLKEINDLLLKKMIFEYPNLDYYLKVNKDFKSLEFRIKV